MTTRLFLQRLLCFGIWSSVASIATTASAGTYSVNTTADYAFASVNTSSGAITSAGAGNGFITLRSAVVAANQAGVGPHTINVPSGTYNLSVNNPNGLGTTWTTNSPDLEIGSDGSTVTIQGAASGGPTKIVQTVAGNDVITTGLGASFAPAIVNLTLNYLEITGGTYTGIFTGADNNVKQSVTTINNCNVHDNSNSGQFSQGGAIYNADGFLTINNTTFSNNSSPKTTGGIGGAIYYSITNAAGQYSIGSLTISSCTFTNNSCGNTSGNGGGGAIYAAIANRAGQAASSITGCTFTSNSCAEDGGAIQTQGGRQISISECDFVTNHCTASGGHGGAIAVENGATTILECRLDGDTVVTSANASEIYHLPANTDTVTANDDWWASETGPRSTDLVGTITETNFDKMTLRTNLTSLHAGGTATLTADFSTDSAGNTLNATQLAYLEGVSISFSAGSGGGGISNAQTTLHNGQATATFTAPGPGASCNPTATVDGASASASISVLPNEAPTITAISDISNLLENAGPQTVNFSGVSPGIDDAGQTLTVTAISDNTTLISPSVSYTSPNATGSVSFTPAANQFGVANITVTVKDNGGTAGGGTDNKVIHFKVTVLQTVQVSFGTSPGGLAYSVDSTNYTSSTAITMTVGTQHTIATTDPQSTTGTHYAFANWSDSGALSHQITISASTLSYTANFNTTYLLTTGVAPAGAGTVTPASGTYYNSGMVVPLLASPGPNQVFTSWTGNVANSSSASTSVTMSGPQTVTANFAAGVVPITFQTSPANLAFMVDSTTYNSSVVLNLAPNSQHTISTTSPQAAAAGTQYAFASWSDSGNLSHTITVPVSATTYTASFTTQYLLTTSANPAAGGTVQPATGYFDANSTVNLTAAPASGRSFVSWNGPVTSPSSASTTIVMTSPATVAANFSASGPTAIYSTGDTVPGEPTGTTFVSFGVPSFDGSLVGFTAVVQPPPIPAVPPSKTPKTAKSVSVIFGENPPLVRARVGGAAPGAGGLTFARFKDPAFGGGHMAFEANLAGVTGPTSTGLWSDASGTLSLLARVGSPAPGTSATFQSIASFALPPAGGAVFTAKLTGGTVTSANNFGLWREVLGSVATVEQQPVPPGAQVELVLQTGGQLTVEGVARTIKSFTVLTAVAGSPGQPRSYTGDGDLKFRVTFTDNSQVVVKTAANNSGFTIEAAGLDTKVTGSTADGPTSPAGAEFGSFGIVAGDTAAEAFQAKLVTKVAGVTPSNASGIFVGDTGNFASVVRQGDATPTIPNVTGATFNAFKDPALTGANLVSFLATLKATSGLTGSGTSLWTNAFGGLKLIALAGGPAPGALGAGGAQIASLSSFANSSLGAPVFVAKLVVGAHGVPGPGGITALNNVGLWATDSAGVADPIVRANDSLMVNGSSRTVKKITILGSISGSPGQGRALNSTAQMIYRLDFADRTQSVFTATIPDPTPAP